MSVTASPFDWDQEVVAIPRQSAIAVHLTEHQDVVLRQQGEAGAPDSIIEVAHQNCLALCATILREAGKHRFRIVEIDEHELVGIDGNRMHIPAHIEEKLKNA